MINQHQRKFGEEIENDRPELGKRPDWLKVRLPTGQNYRDVYQIMRTGKLIEYQRSASQNICKRHKTADKNKLNDLNQTTIYKNSWNYYCTAEQIGIAIGCQKFADQNTCTLRKIAYRNSWYCYCYQTTIYMRMNHSWYSL